MQTLIALNTAVPMPLATLGIMGFGAVMRVVLPAHAKCGAMVKFVLIIRALVEHAMVGITAFIVRITRALVDLAKAGAMDLSVQHTISRSRLVMLIQGMGFLINSTDFWLWFVY